MSLPRTPPSQTRGRRDGPRFPFTGSDHSSCHPLSPTPGRDGDPSLAGTRPILLMLCPCGSRQSPAQSRRSKHAGRTETHGHRDGRRKRAYIQAQRSALSSRFLLCTPGSVTTPTSQSVQIKPVEHQTQCLAHRKSSIRNHLGFFLFFLLHPRTTKIQPRASQKQHSWGARGGSVG